MKEKTKQNITEWIELFGLTALCLVAGFHLNSLGKSDKKQDTQKTGTERVDSVVQRDTAIHTRHHAHTAQELFLDGMRRSLPSR
ncbi:hypothetical protein HDR61_02285 [bacterium]|nr:hypothetical protein [bacterium]